jgi:glycosyltransferase involved in cell wall biosynthesis
LHRERSPFEAMPKLKIAIYTPHWMAGGIERVAKYLIDGLRGDKYEFCVITETPRTPNRQIDLGPYVPIYSRQLAPFDPVACSRLRNLLLKLQPDVAVAMGSSRALYKLPRALVGTDIPSIISEHCSPDRIANELPNSQEFLKALRLSCDYLHVLFDDYAEHAPRPERVRVIPNPVFRAPATLDTRGTVLHGRQRNVILSLARYHLEQKQQDLLIKAFSQVAGKHDDWELHMCGDDWNGGKGKLEGLLQDLRLGDQVFLHPAQAAIYPLLQQAHIFAFPSAYEGHPLAACEALSCGLPIVAYAECSGVNKIVQNGFNGLLARGPTTDVNSYAHALDQLMSNKDLRLKLAANARDSVSDFSPEQFLAGWDDLLSATASKKSDNALRKLSPIEEHYFELLVTAKLFDRESKQTQHIAKLKQEKTAISQELRALKARINKLKRRHKLELERGRKNEFVDWIKQKLSSRNPLKLPARSS